MGEQQSAVHAHTGSRGWVTSTLVGLCLVSTAITIVAGIV